MPDWYLFILYFSFLLNTYPSSDIISCSLSVFCSCSLNPDTLSYFSHLVLPQGLGTWCLHKLKYFASLFAYTQSCYFTYLIPSTTFILAWMSLHQRCLAWSVSLVSILFLWLSANIFPYIYRIHLHLLLYSELYIRLFVHHPASFLLNIMCLVHNWYSQELKIFDKWVNKPLYHWNSL